MNFSNRNTFHHHRVLASFKNIPIQVEAIEVVVEVNPSSLVRNSSQIELCYFRRSNSRRCFLYVTVNIECSFDVCDGKERISITEVSYFVVVTFIVQER